MKDARLADRARRGRANSRFLGQVGINADEIVQCSMTSKVEQSPARVAAGCLLLWANWALSLSLSLCQEAETAAERHGQDTQNTHGVPRLPGHTRPQGPRSPWWGCVVEEVTSEGLERATEEAGERRTRFGMENSTDLKVAFCSDEGRLQKTRTALSLRNSLLDHSLSLPFLLP